MDITPQFDKNATNLCKGIAICIMIYFHAFGATDLTMFRQVFPLLFNVLGPYGNVCVMFFVLLTGYGFAAGNLERERSYGQRILPRLIKLYQSYWAVFLVTFALAPLLSAGRNDWFTAYGPLSPAFFVHILINFLGLSHYAYGGGTYTLNQTWWYMSLALLLILVLPLFCWLWKRCRWGGLLLVTALAVCMPNFRYLGYFPAAMLGVCLAGSDGFVKVRQKSRNALGFILHFVGLFAALLLWYRLRQHGFYILLGDTLAAWSVCQFAFDLLRPIPGLSHVLCWLGKHSGNLFYLHSFVYSFWTFTFHLVFSFRYDLLIWAAIVVITSVLSVALNLLRRVSGYDRLFAKLSQRVIVPPPSTRSPS